MFIFYNKIKFQLPREYSLLESISCGGGHQVICKSEVPPYHSIYLI